MSDQDYLNEAVKRGWVKEDQVPALKETQAQISAKGLSIDILQILTMKGILTRAQVDQLKEAAHPKSMMAFGPYEIVQKVGEGGMGVVYRARRSDQPDRSIALKILHQRALSNEESNLRLRREAEILVKMKHPNIVQGYEFGELNGRFYVAMEFVEGRLVKDMVKERGPIAEKMVLKIAHDMACALEFLLEQGIVHRDIKPDNVMVLTNGAKLMDLGLAKAAGADVQQLTAPGMAMGTPVYMSPEQINGERNLDSRTDIYGLGTTMYYALTGTKPFDGEKSSDIINRKLDKPVPSVRDVRPDVSEATAALVMVMMAKKREDRQQNPAELKADIERVMEGNMPQRLPPPSTKRKSSRRQVSAPTGGDSSSSVMAVQGNPGERKTGRLGLPRRTEILVIILLVLLALGGAYGILKLKGIDPLGWF